LDFSLRSDPGTYALILKSDSIAHVQIGRWGMLDLQPGYYIYVGSAFGPGGVKARVSRHLRKDKQKHWHIDYLREHLTPIEVWFSYQRKHLEHEWAESLFKMPEMSPVQGFGCSDCKCDAHLFFTLETPESQWPGDVKRFPV
jgi:Uri superfamily endonuclease